MLNPFLYIQTVLFWTIHFSISTQFSSIWPIERTLSGAITQGPEWTWEQWQWRGTPHSPKLQQYWDLTIWLFSVISRTLIEEWGSYLSPEMQLVHYTAPAEWATRTLVGGVLPFCRDAVGALYSPSWLSCSALYSIYKYHGLVSLFNGISIFVGYLMPKLSM